MSDGRRWDSIREVVDAPTAWSTRLAIVRGSEVRIHALFVVWIGLVGLRMATGPLIGDADTSAWRLIAIDAAGIALAGLLFEAGRMLAANRLGVAPLVTTLWPFGGLEDLPDRAGTRERLMVAAAGLGGLLLPACVVGGVLARTTGHIHGIAIPRLLGDVAPTELATADGLVPAWLVVLYAIQRGLVIMIVAHLLPAAPLAAGRILRALLAVRLGAARADASAATIGMVAGVVLMLSAAGLGGGLGVLIGVVAVIGAAGTFARSEHRTGADPILEEPTESEVDGLLEDVDPDFDVHEELPPFEPAGRRTERGDWPEAELRELFDRLGAAIDADDEGPVTDRDDPDVVSGADSGRDESDELGGGGSDPAPAGATGSGAAPGRSLGEAELDRILGKIRASGMSSLTASERARLQAETERRQGEAD